MNREERLARIGDLARQRREEIGMGRPRFAEAAGIGSDKTVQNLEFGRRLPNGMNRRKIESALGWRSGAIEEAMRGDGPIRMEDLMEPPEPDLPLPSFPEAIEAMMRAHRDALVNMQAVADLTKVLLKIKELHRPAPYWEYTGCALCRKVVNARPMPIPYPCPTIELIEEAGL